MGNFPINKIKRNLYTEGGELFYLNGELAGTDYVGYYYLADGNVYPGKNEIERKGNPTISSIELDFIPPPETDKFGFSRQSRIKNILRDINDGIGYATRAYIFASNKINQARNISTEVKNRKIIRRASEGTEAITGIHYYAKKINSNVINEISSEDFTNLEQNPIYVLVSIDFSSFELSKQVEEAERKIPGIKIFLGIS